MRKHLRYASYLIRHKWFVFVAGLKTKAPFWRLIIHDYTKLMPVEWVSYARYFYGGQKSVEVVRAFNRGWLHHQHRNPHHWQHWVLREDDGDEFALPMPEKFIREMVADWMGAGRAITGRWGTAQWYESNKHKMKLDYQTQRRVESLLAVTDREFTSVTTESTSEGQR